MEYKEMDSKSVNSLKNLIITLQNYKEDKSETSLSDTIHHTEILLAIFSNTPDEAIVCFGRKDNVGLECLSSLVDVFNWHYVDQLVMKKTIDLLQILGETPETCHLLRSTSLLENLAKAIVKNDSGENTSNMLQLFELLTCNGDMSLPSIYHDDLLSILLEKISNDQESETTLICLEVLRNLISQNMPLQVKCKSAISNSQLRTMLQFLRSDDPHKKILMLSVLLHALYGERQVDVCFKGNNLCLTMSMIFSMLSKSDNEKGQCDAAQLCIDLLKRDKIRSEIELFLTGNKKYFPTLIHFLKKDLSAKPVAKILDMLLELSHISSIRRDMCSSLFDAKKDYWSVILALANSRITSAYHSYENQMLLTAIDVIKELAEEKAETLTEDSKLTWFLQLCEMLNDHLSEKCTNKENETIFLKRYLHCMKILTCLSQEDILSPKIIESIRTSSLQNILEHQLSCNLSGIQKQNALPEWSLVGAELVLEILDFLHKLKSTDSAIDMLLYSILQDKRTMPLLAKAITSCEQSKVLLVIHLVQESSSLPDFPSILLGQKIHEINRTHQSFATKEPNDLFDRLSVSDSISHGDLKELEKSAWNKFKTHSDNEIDVVSVSSSSSTGKENILIESNNNQKHRMQIKPDSKMTEILAMYQQQLADHNLKESHLQDLLEAKACAVAHADRLLVDYKGQLKQCKEQIIIMQKMLHESEAKIEECSSRLSVVEAEKKEVDGYLEEATFLNNTLEQKITQCSSFENLYQEQSKKFESLSRSHCILKREFESMKDLYTEQKTKSDNLETEKLSLLSEQEKLTNDCDEMRARIDELSSAVEEQNEIAEKLVEEKEENEKTIKNMRSINIKLEKSKHDLVIKLTGLEQSRQNENDKHKVALQSHECTIKKLEHEKGKLNQQIDELNNKVESQGEMLKNISSMIQGKN